MRARRFADWSPVRPNGTPAWIATPTRALWLHYGAVGRANFATAVSHTRYHISRLGWLHTGYQGYVIPGQLLLARPAHRMGAHTRGHQTESALCVPGDGRQADVTDRLLDTLAWAAVYGYRQGWWPPEFAGAHRQAPRNRSNTPCAGDPLTFAIPEINRRAARLLRGVPPPAQREDWIMTLSAKQRATLVRAADALADADARDIRGAAEFARGLRSAGSQPFSAALAFVRKSRAKRDYTLPRTHRPLQAALTAAGVDVTDPDAIQAALEAALEVALADGGVNIDDDEDVESAVVEALTTRAG